MLHHFFFSRKTEREAASQIESIAAAKINWCLTLNTSTSTNTSGASRSTLSCLGTESATASMRLCRVKVLWFLIRSSILYCSLGERRIIHMHVNVIPTTSGKRCTHAKRHVIAKGRNKFVHRLSDEVLDFGKSGDTRT